MTSRNYRDLIAWQKAVTLAVKIYEITAKFPQSETFGLVSQMRRSAISIPSNIAEGSKRGTAKDFRQFLLIAYASGAELETQLHIVHRLSWGQALNLQEVESLLDDVMRLLNRLIQSVFRKTKNY